MGAYDSNPRKDASYLEGHPSLRVPVSGGGAVDGDLIDRFSGLAVARGDDVCDADESILQAIEKAETTIRLQFEENNRLKDELQRKKQELEQYKLSTPSVRSSVDPLRHNHDAELQKSRGPTSEEMDTTRAIYLNNSAWPNSQGISSQNGNSGDEPYLQHGTVNEPISLGTNSDGGSKRLPSIQTAAVGGGPSQISSPSSRSLSPRQQKDEQDLPANSPGHCLMPVSEINSSNLWKQDLLVKVREHEEEIAQLRKHLADYSLKEAQILNEKLLLEKRIAYMRMAFDQQQKDLVDAASKALSYRQDIIEENIRLTYALQAAHQERSTFVSSLLPLLSDYGLQPPINDAQSIVSNLKILFKHLQEKLILTEEKLKESQYQIMPWQTIVPNNNGVPSISSHSHWRAVDSSNKNSLEIVPQQAYADALSPSSSPNLLSRELEVLGHHNRQTGPSAVATRNLGNDNISGPPESQNPGTRDPPSREAHVDSRVVRFSDDARIQSPSTGGFTMEADLDESDNVGTQHTREPSVQWGISPNITSGIEDVNPSYPYLPTVIEEPSSSFSEAAEDDPLPAIEGLRLSGEPFPGRELQATGISINGTTSCIFEWVRHFEDGSVTYIEGAKQPSYLVTADDVDSCLALEVQPLDERNRKGELVKVFANDQRKITCDPDMQEQIRGIFASGQHSYEVMLSVQYLDMWENAVLAIKREGYSIKCNGPRGVVVAEKFHQATSITISYGLPNEFSIQSADGDNHILKTSENGPPRDVIVLTFRLFRKMAVEKRKGKKKGIFK